ncbi:MAG: hypothetical protein LBF24_01260 [Puniceicoccales bacterium]|jgi:hypothetical protein|nr:hypothetical protein [Puniceicoccales bacterium]
MSIDKFQRKHAASAHIFTIGSGSAEDAVTDSAVLLVPSGASIAGGKRTSAAVYFAFLSFPENKFVFFNAFHAKALIPRLFLVPTANIRLAIELLLQRENFRKCAEDIIPPEFLKNEPIATRAVAHENAPQPRTESEYELHIISKWDFDGDGKIFPDPDFPGSKFLSCKGEMCAQEIKNKQLRSYFFKNRMYQKPPLACVVDGELLSTIALPFEWDDFVNPLPPAMEAQAILLAIVRAYRSAIVANSCIRNRLFDYFTNKKYFLNFEVPFRQRMAELLPSWADFLLPPDGNFFDIQHTVPGIRREMKYLLYHCFGVADITISEKNESNLLHEIARLYESREAAHVPGGWPTNREQFQTVQWAFLRLLTAKQRFLLLNAVSGGKTSPFLKLLYHLVRSTEYCAFQFVQAIVTIFQKDYVAACALDIDAINAHRNIPLSGLSAHAWHGTIRETEMLSFALASFMWSLAGVGLVGAVHAALDEKNRLAAIELLPPENRQSQTLAPICVGGSERQSTAASARGRTAVIRKWTSFARLPADSDTKG